MANRRFDQFVYSFIKKETLLSGVINLSAAGAVVSFNIPGVQSVAVGSAGVYTITLRDKYNALFAAHVNIAETAQDLDAKPGAVDVSGAKTVVVNTKTAGTNTAPSATCKIYVTLVLSNSSVTSKG